MTCFVSRRALDVNSVDHAGNVTDVSETLDGIDVYLLSGDGRAVRPLE